MRIRIALLAAAACILLLPSPYAAAQQALGTALNADEPTPLAPAFSGCANGNENVAAQNADFEYEVHLRVNNYRVANNLMPLKWHVDLNRAARYHARDMADDNYFEHHTYDCGVTNLFGGGDPPCDSTCTTFERINAFYNWSTAAENIALNQSTPAAVMTAWQNSTGHNANMLANNKRELGVGYQRNTNNVHFWVQNFGARTGQYPVIINLDSLSTASAFVTLHIHRESTTWDEVRLSNDSVTWTPFQAYPAAGSMAWELAAGPAGIRKVYMEQRRSSSPNTVRRYSDDINLTTAHTATGQAPLASLPTLAVWPNPAATQLHVNLEGPAPTRADLLDAQGRLVISRQPGTPSFTLSVDGLAPGLYTLRLATPQGTLAHRVLVQP